MSEQSDVQPPGEPIKLGKRVPTVRRSSRYQTESLRSVNPRFFGFRLPRSLRIGVVITALFVVASVCPDTTAMAETTTTSVSPVAEEQEEDHGALTVVKKIGANINGWAKAAGASAWAALITLQKAVPDFNDLSADLKEKFKTAGLREGARRTDEEAAKFYKKNVPAAVRNLGEDAVWKFVDGKHAAHIQAVANAPELMMDDDNIVWQRAEDNLANGSKNMTPEELARANRQNVRHATGIVSTKALQIATIAGLAGMALESVVSVSENLLYVYKEETDLRQAGNKVAKDMLQEGIGAAIGGAILTVVAALGGGPAIAAAAPILIPIGVVAYLVTAYQRIKTAWY